MKADRSSAAKLAFARWFTVVALLALSAAAHADPREQKFRERLTALNEKCGSKITATFDVKSELGGREPGTGWEYCGSVLEGVSSACSDDDAKPIVASKLKTVSCKMEQGSSKKMHELYLKTGIVKFLDIGFANGTLNAVYDFSTANIDSEAYAFVAVNLGINDAKSLKRHERTFADAVVKANAKCGSKFTATYDINSELTNERPPQRDKGNGYTYCVNVLEGIESVCSDDVKKAVVVKKLKAVTCRMEHGSSKKMRELYLKTNVVKFLEVSFTKGTLAAVYDWNTANISTEVPELLRATL